MNLKIPPKLYVDEEIYSLIIAQQPRGILVAGFVQPLDPKRAIQIFRTGDNSFKAMPDSSVKLMIVGQTVKSENPYYCISDSGWSENERTRHLDSGGLSLEYGENNCCCGPIPPHYYLTIG